MDHQKITSITGKLWGKIQMNYTGIFTASEIEKIESEAWLDLFAAAPPNYAASSEISHERFMGAGVLAHRTVPITEFNRLIAGGARNPWTESEFRAAVEWLRREAASNWAIQIGPGSESCQIREWVAASGLEPAGTGWAKWYCQPSEIVRREIVSDFEIIAVGKTHGLEFGSVVQQGFDLPESTTLWFGALPGRAGWHTYLAMDKGRAVAAAAMFIKGQWAWMGIDTTILGARSRGAQKSLISRRLSDGLEAGMLGFTAETENPRTEGGDGSPSFHNYRNAGFSLAYIRQNYKVQQSN